MGGLFSRRKRQSQAHEDIERAARLQRELEERERAAQAAKAEAERRAREAEREAQRAREAQAAMAAAQAETARVRRETEEARIATEHAVAAEREEAKRREEALREQAARAAEEAQRQQQRAAEETRRAAEAQSAAEDAARTAAEEARAALAAKEEAERQLREGIQPVVMPSPEELDNAKRRIGYREGFYHFAITGVAGSGKSSLINAFRGVKNLEAGSAATGVTETTLQVTRFPDSNPNNHVVWYDVPGAGTLTIRDWQYFNQQGLYVFDALIVLVDNRFTATDVAILRNARLFAIPCYIVRSKADVHIRNIMIERGYDSDEEEEDARSRARLEREAREHFITATRQNVRDNLRAAELPEQRVYIVSNSTMLSAVRKSILPRVSRRMIDELELLQDFSGDVNRRTQGVSN